MKTSFQSGKAFIVVLDSLNEKVLSSSDVTDAKAARMATASGVTIVVFRQTFTGLHTKTTFVAASSSSKDVIGLVHCGSDISTYLEPDKMDLLLTIT